MGRSAWITWTEKEVEEWLKKNGLQEYAPAFVANKIKGKDLPEVIADENALAELVQSSFWRVKIKNKIESLISPTKPQVDKKTNSTNDPSPKVQRILPPGKRYHYFGYLL
jgi:hypothetical protein